MCEHWECPYRYCPYHENFDKELYKQKQEQGWLALMPIPQLDYGETMENCRSYLDL